MNTFAQKIKLFLESEDGPTAVEYAVMLALIMAVCVVAIQAVGTETSGMFNQISEGVELSRTGQVN